VRICYLSHGYPPRSRGGVENHTRVLAEHLAGAGHEVCVFYPLLDGEKGSLLAEESVNGVRLFGFRGGTRDFFGHVSEPGAEAAFADFLKAGRFDVVHVQHTYHGLPLSLVSLAARHAPLVCLTLHDFWLVCPRAHLFIEEAGRVCPGPESTETCARCLGRKLGMQPEAKVLDDLSGFLTARFEAARKAFDAAHVVAAPSRYVLGTVSRALGRNGTGRVMPLGLEKQAGVTRDPANGAVRFTFMGQINRLKNLRVTLDAMRRVSGLAELNVYGRRQDPREAERLERAALADARIRYHGPYGEKRLPEILAKTDVGIVPSLTESFSLVAREFLAAGIPVLAARTGGLPEAVANGVNGMLFDPGDASELAGLMRRCMDEAGFVERLAQGVMPILDAAGDAASWENIYQAGSA